MKIWKSLSQKLDLIEPVYLVLFFSVLISFTINFIFSGEGIFSLLSHQFLKGHLFLPGWVEDSILFEGKYYWHLGPFPALLLVPFSVITLSIFSIPMPQCVVNFILVLGLVFLLKKISIKYGFSKADSVWLSIAVIFASVFFFSAFMPWAWYFSQTITFVLGALALYEYLGKRRYLFIGLLHALIFATRVTSGFGATFYFLDIVFSKRSLKAKVKNALFMIIPIVLSGLFLLCYNYARFGNPFNTGYKYTNNSDTSDFRSYELKKYGLFDLENIPTNFYYYFISVPSPVLEKVDGFDRKMFKTDDSVVFHLVPPFIKVPSGGVSFFVVSPFFLLMFRNKMKNKNSKLALVTSLFILIFLLSYYWTGWTQIGPRYMIDLLPFLLIILLESYDSRKLTCGHKVLIITSMLFNTFLFLSLFSLE